MPTNSAPSSVGGEFGGKTVPPKLSPKIGGAFDVTQAMLLREAQEARQRAEMEHEAGLHAIAELDAELEAMHARLKAEREAAGAELEATRKASAAQLAAERSGTRLTAEHNAASHELLKAKVAELQRALERTARAEAAKVKELEATIETMRREKLNAEREAMKSEAVLAAEVARHKDRVAELQKAFEAARAEATKVEHLEATIEAMRQKRFSVEIEAMKREAAAAAEVTALIKSKELADTMYMNSLREIMRTSANEAQRDKDAAVASLRIEYEKKFNLLKTRVRTMMHQREEMNERGQLEHPPRGLAHEEESASASSGSSPAAAFFYSLGVPGLSRPSLGLTGL